MGRNNHLRLWPFETMVIFFPFSLVISFNFDGDLLGKVPKEVMIKELLSSERYTTQTALRCYRPQCY